MARRNQDDPRTDALLAELRALYVDIDAAYASYGCDGTTECCRFAITGREPYVTSIEVLAVQRAVAARGGPLSPKKSALPLHPKRLDERTCPLLTRHAKCSVYPSRPLGCRTYFCQRATTDAPVAHKQMQQFVRRVKEIAARHEPEGERGRALTRALSTKRG